MRKLRIYMVRFELYEGLGTETTGEWLVEGRMMAEAVVRRIREAYPKGDVSMEQVTVYESESAWARDAWPLDRITKAAREEAPA